MRVEQKELMKKYLFLQLALVCAGSVQGMDQVQAQCAYEVELASSPLFIDELRLLIMEFLFLQESTESESIKNFKVYSSVDKKSQQFLRNDEKRSTTFINFLCKFFYYNDNDSFGVSSFKSLEPFFHEKSVARFWVNYFTFDSLLNMFKEINLTRSANKWELTLKMVHSLKTCSLIGDSLKYIFVGEPYHNYPAKWTLFSAILADFFPSEEVIEFLIKYCATPLDKLHPKTPPPFLVVFNRYLESEEKLARIRSDQNINENTEKEACFVLNYFEKVMRILIKAGASVNSSFYYCKDQEKIYETPLLLTVRKGNIKKIIYLLDKRATITLEIFLETLKAPISDKECVDILEVLVSRLQNNDLLIEIVKELIVFENRCSTNEVLKSKLENNKADWKKRSRALLAMLLKKKAMDAPTHFSTWETTLLEIVKKYPEEEIVGILISDQQIYSF